MNITHKQVLNAFISILGSHTWNVSTPAIKKGPQTSFDETGNVVLVCLGDMSAERPQIGNRSFYDHIVYLVLLVPYVDSDANEDTRCDGITDIENCILNNRQAGGLLSLVIQSTKPFIDTFFGGGQSIYRGAVVTVLCKDLRST